MEWLPLPDTASKRQSKNCDDSLPRGPTIPFAWVERRHSGRLASRFFQTVKLLKPSTCGVPRGHQVSAALFGEQVPEA